MTRWVDLVVDLARLAFYFVFQGEILFLVVHGEADDLGTFQRSALRPDGACARLGIDLIAAHLDDTAHTAIDVGIFLAGVIAVIVLVVESAIELIKFLVGQSKERKAVKGIRDRFAFAGDFLQMKGRNVIVVIIPFAAMAAELVKFAYEERIFAAIV